LSNGKSAHQIAWGVLWKQEKMFAHDDMVVYLRVVISSHTTLLQSIPTGGCTPMKKCAVVGLIALSALVLVPISTLAAEVSLKPRRSFSFDPKPGTECRWFLVTEMSALSQFARTNHLTPTGRRLIAWQLGAMANLNRNQSLGGAFQVGSGSNRYRIAAGAIYRRWLRNRSFVDLTAGPIFEGDEDGYSLTGGSWYVQAGIGLQGTVSLITRLESANLDRPIAVAGRYPPISRRTTMCYAGFTVGGEAGAIVGGISAIWIALATISL
jgi:hypothetical protein